MATSATDAIPAEGDKTNSTLVDNALARFENVIERKISCLKRDLAIENEENSTYGKKDEDRQDSMNLNIWRISSSLIIMQA
jgi:hypothetical protein